MQACQVCGEEGQDRRRLTLGYGFVLTEASAKLVPNGDGTYSILTCKSCRTGFISLLRAWCAGLLGSAFGNNPDATIPYRLDGATMMLTPDEYHLLTGDDPRAS